MKFLPVVTLIASLAVTPVVAQTPNVNLIPELKSKTPEEKEQEAIADKAYRESLRKIPDAKTGGDPWGNVRGTEPPGKPVAAKPSAAKTTQAKTIQTKTTQAKPRPKPDNPTN